MGKRFVLTVTGHRPQKIRNPEIRLWVQQQIRRVLIRAQRKYGRRLVCRAGGALGADMWFEEQCRLLGIPYDVYVPFPGHADRWPQRDREQYLSLLGDARRVLVVTDEPWQGPRDNWRFLRRNEVMLEGSNALLAVWDGGPRGGTAHAVRHWLKTHSKHIHIDVVEHTLGWRRVPRGLPEGWFV